MKLSIAFTVVALTVALLAANWSAAAAWALVLAFETRWVRLP